MTTPPPSKRWRYFEPDASDSDSESDEGFDLESYYDSTTEDRTAEDVQKFISVAFKRCLSHQKRKELAREFPKPQAAKAPETDSLLGDFLSEKGFCLAALGQIMIDHKVAPPLPAFPA